MVGTILRRGIAWRAWVTFAAWVLLADMVPIIIARLNWYPVLLALDTRYVADAMPVLIICLGLAFLPVAAGQPRRRRENDQRHPREPPGSRVEPGLSEHGGSRRAACSAILIVGSIWSASSYQSATTGQPAARYIASVQRAVASAPRGTVVLDSPVPDQVKDAGNGAHAVAGAIRPGKLRWISHPRGTIDGLRMFGLDGRLHPVWVYGASTGRQPAPHACWPERHGRIVMNFWHKPPYLTTVLRIGYIWGSPLPGVIGVTYGSTRQELSGPAWTAFGIPAGQRASGQDHGERPGRKQDLHRRRRSGLRSARAVASGPSVRARTYR